MKKEVYELQNTAVQPPKSSLPPCVVTYSPRERQWTLEQTYTYRDRTNTFSIIVVAPFHFDLASVPRPLWALVSPFDLSIAGPLIHDYLYECGGAAQNDAVVPYRTFTRSDVDHLLLEIMEREGVAAWRRSAAYAAVRLFGGGAWRHAPQDVPPPKSLSEL